MSKRHHCGGFFIVFGSRNRITTDGRGSVQVECPACKRSSRLDGMQARQWFTLYFIPVFPMGSATRFTQCASCRTQFRATIDEMRVHQQGRAGQGSGVGGFPAAIALFNEMRETPGDSEKLLKLLKMYMELGELGEAVSAGKAYPQAASASDECLVILAGAYWRLGDNTAAARHAAAALVLNPNNQAAAAVEKAAHAGTVE